MASPLNVRKLGPGQLGAMMKTVSAQYKATGGRGARNPANATAINNAVGQQVTTFRNNQKNNAVQQQATTYRDSLVNKAVGGQHLKQRQRQENNAVAGFGDTYRARQENKALGKQGRARRKKGGNYTAYGQTGGTLAPSGGGKGRAHVGNSHGVAIVRGDGVFGANRPGAYDLGDSYGVAPGPPKNGPTKGPRKENKALRRFEKQNDLYAPHHGHHKKHGNDGGIVSLGGRHGNKKRRPKKPSYLTGGNSGARYTTGTGAIDPKTGNRLYF